MFLFPVHVQVNLEAMVNLDHRVSVERLVHKVHKVPAVKREHLVMQDLAEKGENLVSEESQVNLDNQEVTVKEASKDQLVHRDSLDHVEKTDNLDLQVCVILQPSCPITK